MSLTDEARPEAIPGPTAPEPDVGTDADAIDEGADQSAEAGRQSLGRRLVPHLIALGVLGALGISEFWSLWGGGHPTTTVLCQCGDPGQTVWFMAWVPWAIAHGHNPLYTDALYTNQGGANLLASTSYLLPALVLSPVTWLFGPTASFNVAETLAPVLSGWCMFLAAGRVSRSVVARVVAAVLWGFSPVIWQAEIYGHLNFALAFFPPLAFLVLHDLLVGKRKPAWRCGLELGLLMVAEFFTGTEPLAITLVAVAAGLVLAAVLAPRRAWQLRRRVVVAAGVAAGVTVVLLAYPLWFLLAGRRHVFGEPWPLTPWFGTGLGAILRAGPDVHRNTINSQLGGYFGYLGPNGAFIGTGLLAFVGVSALAWWRSRLAWVLLLVGALSWNLALGALLLPLTPASVPWWLGWSYLQNLPFLKEIGPDHFSLVAAACLALLVDISIDAWAELAVAAAKRWSASSGVARGRWVRPVATGVAAGCAVLTAIPVAASYTWPVATNSGSTPRWFFTAARHLDRRSVVLTYPYAASGASLAMYWQAADDFSFRLAGGRVEVPGGDGRHSEHVSPFDGSELFLEETSYGAGVPPPPSMAVLRRLRASIADWHVTDVVVVQRGLAPGWAAAVFTEAVGRLPSVVDGAFVWSHVVTAEARSLPFLVDADRFRACVGSGQVPALTRRAPVCIEAARAGAVQKGRGRRRAVSREAS